MPPHLYNSKFNSSIPNLSLIYFIMTARVSACIFFALSSIKTFSNTDLILTSLSSLNILLYSAHVRNLSYRSRSNIYCINSISLSHAVNSNVSKNALSELDAFRYETVNAEFVNPSFSNVNSIK